MSIAEKLNELWVKYEKRISKVNKNKSENEPKDYLIKDGIDPNYEKEYKTQNKKVLFILKESNESNVAKEERCSKSLFDENGWFTKYGSDRAMITKMMKMNKYIQNYEKNTDMEVKNQIVSPDDRYGFAFINLNKHGNGEKHCKEDVLKKHIENDANLLREQIEIFNPNIIVFGVQNHFEDFKINILDKIETQPIKIIITPHFSRIKYECFESQYKKIK